MWSISFLNMHEADTGFGDHIDFFGHFIVWLAITYDKH